MINLIRQSLDKKIRKKKKDSTSIVQNMTLTYSANKELAKQRQQYSPRKHPTSRPLEQIRSGQDLNVNQSTSQLRFPTLATCSGAQVWAKER